MEEKDMMQQEEQEQSSTPGEAPIPENTPENELGLLKAELAEQKEKFIRLYAEFDNFKRRNAKERVELIQTAGREVIQAMLEVVDDCERAEKQMQKTDDLGQVKEGIQLVFAKLRNILQSKGLKEMKSIGEEFNPDFHEAITEIPVPDENMKGKVVDEVEKGYTLNEKIIRFAKVVV
ncbi:MAG: nucleotide exchange factor GrpE, partial [Cyclobacteriaceae bacterium]|nr:nucleotide exchange factor GrpE [Cyclobacteriaceae bacterium]